MRPIKLSFLGTVQAQIGTTAITAFYSAKVRALLAYLAVESNRPHERDLLAEMLWPDEPKEKALGSLRQALHRLAQVLEPAQVEEPLLITRYAVQLNPELMIELDTHQFVDLISEVEAHQHRKLTICGSCVERLQDAVELYRGDFLAGFSPDGSPMFEMWLREHREQLRDRCALALEVLATHQEQVGSYTTATRYLRRWLTLDPWNEEAYQRLMIALALNGQRSAAIAQYEQCRATLAAELGIEPAPETTELATRIRTRRLPERPIPTFIVPMPILPIIDRYSEVTAIRTHLADKTSRLITLVGSGGIGKTRIALEVAAQERGLWTDGIVFLQLAALTTADQLPEALAGQLSIAPALEQQQRPMEALREHLAMREMLLIFDGFEHLRNSAPMIAELLEAAPQVRAIITSRAPLRLSAERVLRIDGLRLPPSGDEGQPLTMDQSLAEYPAVQLFLRTAARVAPGFTPDEATLQTIGAICRAVDGLPLAVTLAAGQVERLSPELILEALHNNLDILSSTLRDLPERHRSVRALFASMWGLLTPQEQHLLAHCTVFVGPFDTAAASALSGQDLAAQPLSQLDLLAEQSLLLRQSQGCYVMHDLIRRLAAERLAAIDDGRALQAAQIRHYTYFLNQLGEAADVIVGPDGQLAIDQIRAALDDIRLAWRRAAERHDLGLFQSSIRGMLNFYRVCGSCVEGATLLRETLEDLRDGELRGIDQPELRCRLLIGLAELLYTCGRYQLLINAAQEAIGLARDGRRPSLEAAALLAWGKASWRLGETVAARTQLTRAQALLRAHTGPKAGGWRRTRSEVHYYLGLLDWSQGRFQHARAHYQAALHIAREIGYRYCESDALNNLALVEIFLGRYDAALKLAQTALEQYRSSANRAGEGLGLISVGLALMYRGDLSAALEAFESSYLIHQQSGDVQNMSMAQLMHGVCHTRIGDYAAARRALDFGMLLSHSIDHRWGLSIGLAYDGLLRLLCGEPEMALQQAQAAIELTEQSGDPTIAAYALTHLGRTFVALSSLDHAEQPLLRALAIREATSQRHLAVDALASLARLEHERGHQEQALRYVQQILDIRAQTNLQGAEEPAHILSTCITILSAADDPEAQHVAEDAEDLITALAARIISPAQRQLFMRRAEAAGLTPGHLLPL